MAIFNLGSCCIDHVYAVPSFVAPGETLPCTHYEVHPGGKGLNQSIALARAGAEVIHAGKVGEDGRWLKNLLSDSGVDTSNLLVADSPTGHANIQVAPNGENAIVLFGGTNQLITIDEITSLLERTQPGDFLVLQNEISELHAAIDLGASRDLCIVLNAAPMTSNVKNLPLDKLELIIINELEGEALSGKHRPEEILDTLSVMYPELKVALTLGRDGAVFRAGEFTCSAKPLEVETQDTTGAGDTFTGYFIAEYANDTPSEEALMFACAAASVSVTRNGAATSIPFRAEVEAAVKAAA